MTISCCAIVQTFKYIVWDVSFQNLRIFTDPVHSTLGIGGIGRKLDQLLIWKSIRNNPIGRDCNGRLNFDLCGK